MYFIRRKPKIDKNEIRRYYGRIGDLNPTDVFLKCDMDDTDETKDDE